MEWSGAGTATQLVDIGVVEAGAEAAPALVRPSSTRGRKSWSRQAREEWLRTKLTADARWYARTGVPFYRQTELLIPQAISQFYLGSVGVVGFQTITLPAALHELGMRRARDEILFDVWPHEIISPRAGRHVMVEMLPISVSERDVSSCPCRPLHGA